MARLMILLLLITGCSTHPYSDRDHYGADAFVLDSYQIREGKYSILEFEGRPLETLDPKLLCDYRDEIEDGDVLKIVLYHPTRHDLVKSIQMISDAIGFRVSDGKVRLPDLAPVEVGNLTLSEAQASIEKAYSHEIEDVDVYLSYRARLERKVELAGLVQISEIPTDGKMRLFDVISKAKIPPNANLFKSYVIREGRPLPVDMNRLIKLGDMGQNIVMHPSDKIYIASEMAANVMVMGEVGKPGTLPLLGGYLPLREALAQSGGILFTGDKGYIQVIRGNLIKPKIYTLHWQHIIRLPTSSMLLMPGDIVYVAATPITEWNRFISQLFPSFTAIDFWKKGIIAIP